MEAPAYAGFRTGLDSCGWITGAEIGIESMSVYAVVAGFVVLACQEVPAGVPAESLCCPCLGCLLT